MSHGTKIKGDLSKENFYQHENFEMNFINKSLSKITVSGSFTDVEISTEFYVEKKFDSWKNANAYLDLLIKKYPNGEYIIITHTQLEHVLYTNL